mmetsp:Transcript_46192/g.110116  ORF Transcript_46192/g.110116 Transcript_46192/m.110116 type:complete len:127 (-) Transcript_46192:125-505(-)|eukprot:CAMPEP_0180131058 /NCGR_PEP_ID=MMETSP0986-20121125/8208_1 /TAXON_ID=697907 /ORGANISM="non described non described, Strain CCMP2293" /LENGTH=126 /DNA_ID=CAMNT_0022070891 /DNA_START=155 /DNA_END=538 /DNA_ORIENTATION=+
MGCVQVKSAVEAYPTCPENAPVEEFMLRHPGTCSGMFWRDDPRPWAKTPTTYMLDQRLAWPKNGAVLRGVVHTLETPVQRNTKWLEVHACQQPGAKSFDTTPWCWMQFDQGGLLLHSPPGYKEDRA